MKDIQICASPEDAARQAAQVFSNEAEAAIRERGRFCVLLSGGSTPARTYKMLAEMPLGWARIHFFWGDERAVGPESPRSNFRMAQEALLSKIEIPQANIHRIQGELDPNEAARRYEREIRAFFPEASSYPRFDFALQGLGPDGHTASLFPGSLTEIAGSSWVIAPFVEKQGEFRISVSLGVLNAARLVLFLVLGEEKAEIVQRVLTPPADHQGLLPAQRVDPRAGRLLWLLDPASAARFETGGREGRRFQKIS